MSNNKVESAKSDYLKAEKELRYVCESLGVIEIRLRKMQEERQKLWLEKLELEVKRKHLNEKESLKLKELGQAVLAESGIMMYPEIQKSFESNFPEDDREQK